MPERISRAAFASKGYATKKNTQVALSKASDLAIDTSDVGVASRTVPFIISTAAVDRDGDTLALDGWDLDDYRKNPIILFDHDSKSPIGTSVSIGVEDDTLKSVGFFPTKDVNELSDWAYRLIEAKILRTASVTFLPIEYTVAADRSSNSMWGMPPMNFIKQKLLEWSVVSVPSNQEALCEAKSLSVDWKSYHQWIEKALDTNALAAPRTEYEKTHAVVKSFLGGGSRVVAKGVLPFKKTPLADKSASWDGPKEKAEADVDDLKVMCAWYDSDNPDVKSSYKLPHHEAKPPHKLVWRGVTAAMSALLGGRGGVDIPEKDRKAVYEHLSKSYREFGEDPPEFKSIQDSNMSTSKAGKVLSKENAKRLTAAVKHHAKGLAAYGKAMGFHEKAMKAHEEADKANDKAMKACDVDGEEDPSNTGVRKHLEKAAKSYDKAMGFHEKAEDLHDEHEFHQEKCKSLLKALMASSKDEAQDVSGQEDDKPGNVGGDETVADGDGTAADYYEEYNNAKSKDDHDDDDDDDDDDEDGEDRREKSVLRHSRAALSKGSSILDEQVSEEELKTAFQQVIDESFDSAINKLRGRE